MTEAEPYFAPYYVRGNHEGLLAITRPDYGSASLRELQSVTEEAAGPHKQTVYICVMSELAIRLDQCLQTSDTYLQYLEAFYTAGQLWSTNVYDLQQSVLQDKAEIRRAMEDWPG